MRSLYMLIVALACYAVPVSAQQWDQVNGSMQVKSGPTAPLVIIDQTASGQKILSLRAASTEVCYADNTAFTCTGGFALGDSATLSWSDVSLSRGAANRLDLATGDSLYLVSGGLGVGTLQVGAGTIENTGEILAGTNIRVAAASALYWAGSRVTARAPASAQLVLTQGAESVGVGLDFATDGVLTVNNRAQTGAAAIGQGPAASATSSYKLVKKVTGIADNTATDIVTVTVPNANHAATIKVTLLSSNGSTDAFESSRTAEGAVVLARTTGANAIAVVATLTLAQIATVAAGATHTLAYGVSAISGAVGAVNTFTIQVTIDDSGNLGSNQCVVMVEIVNAETTGVTIT